MAKLTYPKAELYTRQEKDSAHAFVRLGGRFYDSWVPGGVETAGGLWFPEEAQVGAKCLRQTPRAFMKTWGTDRRVWAAQHLEPWPRELPPPTSLALLLEGVLIDNQGYSLPHAEDRTSLAKELSEVAEAFSAEGVRISERSEANDGSKEV